MKSMKTIICRQNKTVHNTKRNILKYPQIPNKTGAIVVVIVWCLNLKLHMQSGPIPLRRCVLGTTLCDKVCQ
jgi:hypothetical protein